MAFAVAASVVSFAPALVNAQLSSADPAPTPTAAPVTAWKFTPQFGVQETYTDNGELVPAATARKNWITDSSVGLRIEKRGVRSRLFVDYSLHDFRYSKDTKLNKTQRLLNSNATVEAIDRWLYVDASSNITQENRSPFRFSAANDASGVNSNRIETTTNQVSPHVRGKLADIATYQLRFVGADIRSNDAALPDTRGKQWTGFIKSESVGSGVGWSVDGNAISFRNNVVGKAHDERVSGTVSYEFSSQIHVSAIAGSEVTNFAGRRSGAKTSGVGLAWSPDARTQFAAVKEKRFFGDSHSVSLSHRTPLSAWKFKSTRDVTSLSSRFTSGSTGSTAGLLSDLLASSIPDPIAREVAVRARLEASGIASNSALSAGFATGRALVVRDTEASVALSGVYNTITLTFLRRDQRAFGAASAGTDSFSLSSDIRQEGANLNWSYKLSPHSSLSLVATTLRSEALSASGLDSSQRTVNMLFSTRVGVNTFATLGARRVILENSTNTGHRENAVLGSVSLRY
jgi:uncharacterized protein (PEP-CTERM system associated)